MEWGGKASLDLSTLQQKVARYFPTERGQPMVHGALSVALSSVRTTDTHVERVLSLQFRDQSLKRSLVHLHFPTWPELYVHCSGWWGQGQTPWVHRGEGLTSGLVHTCTFPPEACQTALATCCASSRRCMHIICTSDPCTHLLSYTAGREPAATGARLCTQWALSLASHLSLVTALGWAAQGPLRCSMQQCRRSRLGMGFPSCLSW